MAKLMRCLIGIFSILGVIGFMATPIEAAEKSEWRKRSETKPGRQLINDKRRMNCIC